MNDASIHLVVRRTIPASPERVFAAWTTPALLRSWWGPKGVECPSAEVDLRVGGRYRLGNRMPSGDTVWISGVFEAIEPPCKLVYTWVLEPATTAHERVTVRFEACDTGTEVIVVHERIASTQARDQHETGWDGCLHGLAALFDSSGASTVNP